MISTQGSEAGIKARKRLWIWSIARSCDSCAFGWHVPLAWYQSASKCCPSVCMFVCSFSC